jgi:AraC family transcriptional regulator
LAQAAICRQRLSAGIDHACDHLDEPLPLDTLARVAGISPFHFHRLFKTLTAELGWREFDLDCAVPIVAL